MHPRYVADLHVKLKNCLKKEEGAQQLLVSIQQSTAPVSAVHQSSPPVVNCFNNYYPVDISTTVFSYSRAVQYHTILHGCYCMGPEAIYMIS